jgi:hypothetical protein
MVKAAELLLRGASTKDIANLLIPADLMAGTSPAGAKTPPKVGEIKSGYRYAGGDPAQRSSWVKQ